MFMFADVLVVLLERVMFISRKSIGQGSKSVDVCNTGSYLSAVWHAPRLGRAVGGEVC